MVNKVHPCNRLKLPFAQKSHCKLVSEFVKEITDYHPSLSQTDQISLVMPLYASVAMEQGKTSGAEELTSGCAEREGFAALSCALAPTNSWCDPESLSHVTQRAANETGWEIQFKSIVLI